MARAGTEPVPGRRPPFPMDEVELNLEPAQRLARLINCLFVMSLYMSGSRVCGEHGIDGWGFLLPKDRRKREERMEREKRKS